MSLSHKLTCVSYNCRGVKLNDPFEVRKLLEGYDICCFQETWMSHSECKNINNVVKSYRAIADSPNNDSNTITIGRQNKKGGVAIMWNCSMDKYVTPISFGCDFAVGIKISFESKVMYIINVY